MRSTPKVALTGVAFRPRLVRLVRPFPQGAVWKFLSGIDRLGMAEAAAKANSDQIARNPREEDSHDDR